MWGLGASFVSAKSRSHCAMPSSANTLQLIRCLNSLNSWKLRSRKRLESTETPSSCLLQECPDVSVKRLDRLPLVSIAWPHHCADLIA